MSVNMNVNEIVEKLQYYTPELPKEALIEAIRQKKEITPKLLKMLEYTKENLNEICNDEDDFFGYNYAFFLLAEFKEKQAFPYFIDLLHMDEEIVEFLIGDDYPDYLARLLASTYNGDDKALYDVIENEKISPFIRGCCQQVFAILYLHEVKDRKFIVQFYKKILNDSKNKIKNKNEILFYDDIIDTVCSIKLTELTEDIEKILYIIENEDERQEMIQELTDSKPINKNLFPLKPLYEYIHDTVEIMEKWQCFREIEDSEFEDSDDFEFCQYKIYKREQNVFYVKSKKIGRNDLCYCGSGKKYKNCCINKDNDRYPKFLEMLNSIDMHVCKAEWYLKRKEEKKAEELYRYAWFDVQTICKENDIKTLTEYEKKYNGYNYLSNWLQDYDDILEKSNEEDKLYERLSLWNAIEEIFDLNNEDEIYWKERAVREKANVEFRLGNEEKATEIIENYLKVKPYWVWGYAEMSDWYDDKSDEKHYNLEKSKEILLRAEKNVNLQEDIEPIFERLWSIYERMGDKENAKIYESKINVD